MERGFHMSKVKYIVSIVILGCALLAPSTMYAAEIKPTPAKTDVNKTEVIANKQDTPTSTSSAITFEKDEYVRITQSLENKEEIQTFDSQINIMGEARKGTKIDIIVYTGEKVDSPVATESNNYKVYTVKEVGATMLFSQLIDLKEGQNNILIKYIYPPNEKTGKIELKIVRKTDKEKEQIKSFIVDDPGAVLGRISAPTTTSQK